MRFLRYPSFLFLFLLCGLTANAQEDNYVITTRGDSLTGKIKLLSFDIDQVQIKTSTKKVVIKATQVSTLHLNGITYRPQRRNNSYRFMQVLHDGYLALYAFRDVNLNTFDGRFISKKDGSSMDVPNLGFKKAMTRFLEDCPVVSGKIETGELGRAELDEIINQYNFCIGQITAQRQELAKMYVSPESPKLTTLDVLKKKVQSLPEFANKKDAIELLTDIREKVSRNAALPGYQLAGLKEYLGPVESVKDELAKFLEALSKN